MAEVFTRTCRFCKNEFVETEIQEHHIHPRFMDNPKGDGMQFGICKKCHDITHGQIAKIVWSFVSEEKKEECIDAVKNFALKKRNGF